MGFYETTFWVCSHLIDFFGFSSSARPLNGGVPQGSVLGPLSSPSVFSLQWTGASCLFSLSTLSLRYGFVPVVLSSTFSSALSSGPRIGAVNSLLEVSTLVSSGHLRLSMASTHSAPHTPNKMVALSTCSRRTRMTSLFHLLGLRFSY